MLLTGLLNLGESGLRMGSWAGPFIVFVKISIPARFGSSGIRIPSAECGGGGAASGPPSCAVRGLLIDPVEARFIASHIYVSRRASQSQ